jgi:hypothetical protein
MSISNTLGVNSGGNVIFEATDISVSYSAVAAVVGILQSSIKANSAAQPASAKALVIMRCQSPGRRLRPVFGP